jgi:hypothetical protein
MALSKQLTPHARNYALVVLLVLVTAVVIVTSLLLNSQRKITPQQTVANISPTPKPIQYTKLTPPDVDTSNWKMYVDPILKYSIKYPSNIEIDLKGDNPGEGTAFMFTNNPTPKNEMGAGLDPLQIDARGSTGYDAYHGYQKSEGSCVSESENCYAYTHIPSNIIWVNINNAYGIEAPFDTHTIDYYLTDARKSNQVIRMYSPFITYQNRKFTKDEIHIIEQMVRTLRFERD